MIHDLNISLRISACFLIHVSTIFYQYSTSACFAAVLGIFQSQLGRDLSQGHLGGLGQVFSHGKGGHERQEVFDLHLGAKSAGQLIPVGSHPRSVNSVADEAVLTEILRQAFGVLPAIKVTLSINNNLKDPEVFKKKHLIKTTATFQTNKHHQTSIAATFKNNRNLPEIDLETRPDRPVSPIHRGHRRELRQVQVAQGGQLLAKGFGSIAFCPKISAGFERKTKPTFESEKRTGCFMLFLTSWEISLKYLKFCWEIFDEFGGKGDVLSCQEAAHSWFHNWSFCLYR